MDNKNNKKEKPHPIKSKIIQKATPLNDKNVIAFIHRHDTFNPETSYVKYYNIEGEQLYPFSL